MVSLALNAHEKQNRTFSEWVWFEGTTALKEGQAVCFNYNFGTDTEADARRFSKVEVPSVTNSLYFAGVCARKYAASASGQMIEIYLPGSICLVLVGADTVLGAGRLTFEITSVVATNGTFINEGMEGEGSCIPLQTTTFDTTAALCLVKLDPPGRPSGGFETVQLVDQAAFVAMAWGTTGLIGAALTNANATETLIAGTVNGQRKRFLCITTEITTNDAVITITNGRSHALADTSLESVTFTAAASLAASITLEWTGGWMVVGASETQPVIA